MPWTVVEYPDLDGSPPWARRFLRLDVVAAAKVATALYRLEQGHRSSVKPVGQGVSEYRIDFGPGYRVDFGQDGALLVVLLGGGTKKRQAADIQLARKRWVDYKSRRHR